MQSEPQARSLKPGPSTACVCTTLRKAARAVTQLYDEYLRLAGLRATQYSLLKQVLTQEPVTVNQLAEATVTDRTTLSRNLRILQQGGFIDLRAGQDRREHEVRLTPQGRKILIKADRCWERAQGYVLDRLGEERWNILREELGTLVGLSRQG